MRLPSDALRVLAVFVIFAATGQQRSPHRGFHEIPPFHLPAGVVVEHNLIYARYGMRSLHLDLYHPSTGRGPFPGVVFIHGGGWVGGPLIQFRRQAAFLASQGFVAATIEYRLSKETKYPAPIYDCKAAVRWMRASRMKYRIDGNKIAAAGGSAGAHLAAMLGTTNGIQRFEGRGGHSQYSSSVQAVVAFNGIYDLVALFEKPGTVSLYRDLSMFLGGALQQVPELYVDASPIAHVCSNSPPFLLLHGTGDTTVPYQQALEMQMALRGAGVRADLYSAKGANHGFFNYPPYYQPALERMVEFLHGVFRE